MRRLFLLAYACSGLAGLIYEVSWTRLLTLYIGHTTGAASAVVAAFLGGLAVGAAAGAVLAARLSPRQSLYAYVSLEACVIAAALILPLEISALAPVLGWAYDDGRTALLFASVRLLICLVLVFLPAAALGATFPTAIRWFARDSDNPARSSGALYAVNTVGAAIGALLAGFLLIPSVGISGTTRIGIAASALAALTVLLVARLDPGQDESRRRLADDEHRRPPRTPSPVGLVTAILALSGFAALIHEIVWTRVLSLVLGPTIYAFAATLAAVIAGVALGSFAGTWIVGRTRQPAAWLTLTLVAAAVTASIAGALAGSTVPMLVARRLAQSPALFESLMQQTAILTSGLVLPTAACLGGAFPLALSLVDGAERAAAGRRFGIVYAVNTVGAVSGSLLAGYVFIPFLGLQTTLRLASGCLIAAAAALVLRGGLSGLARIVGTIATLGATGVVIVSPPWDRALLASGPYLYAPYVPKDLDLGALLKAGTLLYYRDGAAATISVKRLTGTTTLAVDGKVDASNRSDMLTQKLIAHLPLLLHDNPREIAIVGLGSGVTVGSALRHPIARADVIEISPEVVAASSFFAAENHRALEDPRTNLIVGDGRSHLLLSNQRYDVIVSEPSNPWIAGVAGLFTREFFVAARDRLAPGGIVCQWANTYNISDRDLRSIVATFISVFPDGIAWLIGGDDLVMVASTSPIAARLENLERHWRRPGVAEDLAEVAAVEPFSILSMYLAGPAQLSRYAAGAAILSDDRMTLEFSGPRQLHSGAAGDNGAALTALLEPGAAPSVIRDAMARAGAAAWRDRAAMMAKSDVHSIAYDDYVRSLTIDLNDSAALDGFVRSAVLAGRATDALAWLDGRSESRPTSPLVLVATSRLLAANGSRGDAIAAATLASRLAPGQASALEQLASLHADGGETAPLDTAVTALQAIAPDRAPTYYYSAVSALLKGRLDDAVRSAEHAITLDPQFAPGYDLLGAAYTKLDRPDKAREAFLGSLRFDAHDSTAYTNLGLLELAAGNRPAAANYFAEALGLAPGSRTAREGLARARAGD